MSMVPLLARQGAAEGKGPSRAEAKCDNKDFNTLGTWFLSWSKGFETEPGAQAGTRTDSHHLRT